MLVSTIMLLSCVAHVFARGNLPSRRLAPRFGPDPPPKAPSAEEDTNVPVEQPTDTPPDNATDTPTDNPTDHPMDTPPDNATDTPTDTPPDNATDTPPDNATDNPTEPANGCSAESPENNAPKTIPLWPEGGPPSCNDVTNVSPDSNGVWEALLCGVARLDSNWLKSAVKQVNDTTAEFHLFEAQNTRTRLTMPDSEAKIWITEQSFGADMWLAQNVPAATEGQPPPKCWWPIGFRDAIPRVPAVIGKKRDFGLQLLTMLANRDSEWIEGSDGIKIEYFPVLEKAERTPIILETTATASKLKASRGYTVFRGFKDGDVTKVELREAGASKSEEFDLGPITADIFRLWYYPNQDNLDVGIGSWDN